MNKDEKVTNWSRKGITKRTTEEKNKRKRLEGKIKKNGRNPSYTRMERIIFKIKLTRNIFARVGKLKKKPCYSESWYCFMSNQTHHSSRIFGGVVTRRHHTDTHSFSSHFFFVISIFLPSPYSAFFIRNKGLIISKVKEYLEEVITLFSLGKRSSWSTFRRYKI